jgi:methylated-DNA-[protein]-cysteine S-methyltransferase
MTSVPDTLDRRFRDAASAAGLLDVSYDVSDSPVGPLFVALTDRGLCRISYDPEPDRLVEELARTFGSRVLRAPRAVDPVVRELDEYFEGRRRGFDLPVDLRGRADFSRVVLEQLARVPFGEVTTYGALAAQAGRPRAARAVGTVMNRNPIPIVLPCHRVVGASGDLVGYGGGLDRKRLLLDLESAELTLDIDRP